MFLSSAESETYKAEIEELKSLLSKNEERRLALAGDKAQLQSELEQTKELLASARAAKENGCLRGEYCGHCKHHIMVRRYPGSAECTKCICTYGACPHFEKEAAE